MSTTDKHRCTARPTAPKPVRQFGRIEGLHRGGTGLWIRTISFNSTPFFAPFELNRRIRPDTADGTRVEFTLTHDAAGRPIAVDVQPLRRAI